MVVSPPARIRAAGDTQHATRDRSTAVFRDFRATARNLHLADGMLHGSNDRGKTVMPRFTSLAVATAFVVAAAVGMPATADAGCGCAKPPPPRAAVRPFAGYVDQRITLFSDVFVPGTGYAVQFTSTIDNSTDWSKGRATLRRDFADGQFR